MTRRRSDNYLQGLVEELRSLPEETEWVEFKRDKAVPDEIGEYLSALANSAALEERPFAYLVWGIDNNTHTVVGTSFRPRATKVGNEELEHWLVRGLEPRLELVFHEVEMPGGLPIVMLEVERAWHRPVAFKKEEFIRVGSQKRKLKDNPQKERELWKVFNKTPFEKGVAAEHVDSAEALRLIDYPSVFTLLGQELPASPDKVLSALAEEGLVEECPAGGWNVTNLGAILFAKDLAEFPSLSRKALRVVRYEGRNRVAPPSESPFEEGYAPGFEDLIRFLLRSLPPKERFDQPRRRDVPQFPEEALRELVPNALIHQDFSVTGSSPMIEIFSDRVEITNPGAPLIEANRFIDMPPRSRNETLASLMRRIGVCEERGSGWDKVMYYIELHQLPAPLIEVTDNHTRVTLFKSQKLSKMSKEDRVRAVYLHACLRHVQRERLTNTSLRQRFGLREDQRSTASRFIREAVGEGFIVSYDPTRKRAGSEYVPFWAAPEPA